MTTKKKYYLFFLIGLILFSSDIYAQKTQEPVNRILFVFDASQSMLGRWQSGRKIDIAKQLLTNITDSLKDVKNLEIALRVYGHQRSFPPQDCDDTKLEINFLPSEIFADRIKGKLSMIKAKGTTPIARSLEEAASDFPKENSRNIVILITDGKEECGMDPCAVSRLFAKKGIILKPFVIGIGLDQSWKKNLDCVGTFFDASFSCINVRGLHELLRESCENQAGDLIRESTSYNDVFPKHWADMWTKNSAVEL